jgi:hypothetical protein
LSIPFIVFISRLERLPEKSGFLSARFTPVAFSALLTTRWFFQLEKARARRPG